jgi:hypothetical protein
MDAKLITEAEILLRVAERLERVGLIIDRTSLSSTHRRAIFALQCLGTASADRPEAARPPIGFPYPNAR